jgi:hypothetical protein
MAEICILGRISMYDNVVRLMAKVEYVLPLDAMALPFS